MSKRKRKAKYGTGRGRPAKDGARQPDGRLVQKVEPNAVVLAERRALVGASGDLTKATSDLDIALERGWLSEEEHRAARAYASLYRRAGLELPRMRTANLGEAEGEYAKEVSRAGVVQTGAVIRPVRDLQGDPEAQDTLRLVWAVLRPAEKTALAHACLCEGTLDFVRLRAKGVSAVTRAELDLKQGLLVVRTVLDPRLRRGHSGQNDLVEVA